MTAKDESPTFNFDGISRKWNKEMTRIQVKMASLALSVQNPSDSDSSKVEFADKIFELEDKRDQLLIDVVMDVPQSWLVSNAPKDLKWDKVEDLDWMLSEKFEELTQLALTARQSSAKN